MSEKHESNWVNGTDQYTSENPGKPTEAKPRDPTGDIQKPTEGAYQQNGQSWLGGPQNGIETPGNGGNGGNASGSAGSGDATSAGADYTKHRFNETNRNVRPPNR